MVEILHEWKDFNVAIVGATAALAGLVIVAASVNIADIVKSRPLTARLGSAIASLVVALVVAALGLIPGLNAMWFGGVVLALAAILLAFQVLTIRLLVSERNSYGQLRWTKSLLGLLPVAAYAASGVLGLAGAPAALIAAAVGAILAIVAAIIISWVALVEVLR
ncbi:MAG: hypothetical protein ACTHZ9_01870 [Leucobacter sp.]